MKEEAVRYVKLPEGLVKGRTHLRVDTTFFMASGSYPGGYYIETIPCTIDTSSGSPLVTNLPSDITEPFTTTIYTGGRWTQPSLCNKVSDEFLRCLESIGGIKEEYDLMKAAMLMKL